MSNQLELFNNEYDDYAFYIDWTEAYEDFEIRQAMDSGDLDRVNQLLDLKGCNSYM